jgi:hypothetical protein
MGGYQVPGQGSGDDGYDEEGYDESQRAEILEATQGGPTDGNVLTDLVPDLGNEDEDDEDDLRMTDGELGEEDDDAALTAEDSDEDEVQAAFDDDEEEDDEDELGDADEDALEP